MPDRDHSSTQVIPGAPSSPLPWLVAAVAVLAGAGALVYGRYLLRVERQRGHQLIHASEEAALRLKESAEALANQQEKLSHLNEENQNLRAHATALSNDLKLVEAELVQAEVTYRLLNDQLRGEILQGEVQLGQDSGRIHVTIAEHVLFDGTDGRLTPQGEGLLDRVGRVLAQANDRQIQVAGHSEDSRRVGRSDRLVSSWEQSAARALSVVRYLTDHAGVPPGRLVAEAYGKFHPGRAHNPRVELSIGPTPDAETNASAAANAGPKKQEGARKSASHRRRR